MRMFRGVCLVTCVAHGLRTARKPVDGLPSVCAQSVPLPTFPVSIPVSDPSDPAFMRSIEDSIARVQASLDAKAEAEALEADVIASVRPRPEPSSAWSSGDDSHGR